MVATSFPCQPRWGATMALGGSVSLGEGGAPAVLLFRIPYSRLHQLRVNECNRDFSTVTHSFRLSKHKVQAAGKVLGLLTILPESCWRLATSPEKLDCTTGVGRRVSHREPARRTETPRRSCCLGPPSGPPGLNGRVAGLYLLARRAARELEAGDAGLPTCCTGKLAS